jgi:hypothetical protein
MRYNALSKPRRFKGSQNLNFDRKARLLFLNNGIDFSDLIGWNGNSPQKTRGF